MADNKDLMEAEGRLQVHLWIKGDEKLREAVFRYRRVPGEAG